MLSLFTDQTEYTRFLPAKSNLVHILVPVPPIQRIFSPEIWLSSQVCVGAMIGWVLRLLISYDPNKRRKWGRYTKEKRIFRTLIVAYVLLETGAWALVSAYGVEW